jgi:hypothetical protein
VILGLAESKPHTTVFCRSNMLCCYTRVVLLVKESKQISRALNTLLLHCRSEGWRSTQPSSTTLGSGRELNLRPWVPKDSTLPLHHWSPLSKYSFILANNNTVPHTKAICPK